MQKSENTRRTSQQETSATRLVFDFVASASGFVLLLSAAIHFDMLPADDPFKIFGKSYGKSSEESRSEAAKGFERDPLSLRREAILRDPAQRISKTFAIQNEFINRVGFWFDVYSRYDDKKKIVHHERYPWVIYNVFDVSELIDAQPGPLWLRLDRAEKKVRAETQRLREVIARISTRRDFENLTLEEIKITAQLNLLSETLGQDFTQVAKDAAQSVRVQTGQKNHFVSGIKLSAIYLPEMEKIFSEKGLPLELTRLPFVESSFQQRATSRVGAAGIWQFVNLTGKKFLHISGDIDERRSPIKATAAAATLLKENYLILGRSWPLAITAWNHGPTGVRRAIHKTGSRDLTVIAEQYRSRSFDFASANFYAEFLAALYVEKYQDKLFEPLVKHAPQDIHQVRLSHALRFHDLIRLSGVGRSTLLHHNPDLTQAARKNAMIPKGFRLYLPSNAITQYLLISLDTACSQPLRQHVGDVFVDQEGRGKVVERALRGDTNCSKARRNIEGNETAAR